MNTKPKSSRADIVKRVVTPAALWVVNKALDQPRVKKQTAGLQSRVDAAKKKALRSIQRAARNAASNPAWLAASAAAFALGIGLIAKASRG
ncbi:MAG TPA: hypothetical protein VMU84_14870 [Thermoanaerobaculia bacterium]|nr:hypothetical protein [Thermoanaerobaculia bacterium]